MDSMTSPTFTSVLVYLSCGLPTILLGWEWSGARQDQGSPVSVSITVDKREHRTLEPISLTILVKNESKNDIYLKLGCFADFMADLKVLLLLNNQKMIVPKSQYYNLGNLVLPDNGGNPVAPGESREINIVANMISDMTLPGNYEISATVPYWFTSGRPEAGRKTVSSDTVKVRITKPPRSPKKQRNWNSPRVKRNETLP